MDNLRYYIDGGYIQNPLFEYFKWLGCKTKYQVKYWGSHLRVGYMTKLSNVKFGKFNFTGHNVVISNSELGDFSYVASGSVILEASIGKFCSIGPGVKIAPGRHATTKFVSTHPATYSNPPECLKTFSDKDQFNPKRKVVIGNDVWICANAVIGDGVSIGDGAVVASNSVVTRNVKPYSIVGGLPAEHIIYRFEADQIKLLLEKRWWDNDISWLEQNAPLLWDIRDYLGRTQ